MHFISVWSLLLLWRVLDWNLEAQMEGVMVVSKDNIQHILTYPLLIQHIQTAFAQFSIFQIPPPTNLTINPSSQSSLLLRPAWCNSPDRPYLLVKSVTVFPDNGAKGLPAVAGELLAVMDGTELILWRTACTSAVAADHLAPKDAKVMVMVGAGALAPHLIKAHLITRPSLQKILVWNRTHAAAVKLVEDLKSSPLLAGRVVEAVTDLESSVRAGNIISCATLACEPLILGTWLAPGTHVDLVGSFTPLMRECDDATIRSARVVVDSLAAIEDSGDLVQPLHQKVICREHILGTLADLMEGKVSVRSSSEEITVYKSVGCTVGDFAAAQLVYEYIRSKGITPCVQAENT